MNKFEKFATHLFEFVDYYCLDLLSIPDVLPENQIEGFAFSILNKNSLGALTEFTGLRGTKYVETVKKRLENSGRYSCFAFTEQNSGKVVYTRWICRDEFYSTAFKETFYYDKTEVLTLDSYTHPDYRFLGLHKEMNIRMINHLIIEGKIKKIYMVIFWFFPYLHTTVKTLGYRKIRSKVYYKKGSIRTLLTQVFMKFKKNK